MRWESLQVAVHCHAGFGRTGIVVACLALILKQLTAEDAIALVRSKRYGGQVVDVNMRLFVA